MVHKNVFWPGFKILTYEFLADTQTRLPTGRPEFFFRQRHIFLFTTVPTGPPKFLQELDTGGHFQRKNGQGAGLKTDLYLVSTLSNLKLYS
jgi:hypothetical protein